MWESVGCCWYFSSVPTYQWSVWLLNFAVLISSLLLCWQKQTSRSGSSLNVAVTHLFNLYGKICRCRTDRPDIIYFSVAKFSLETLKDTGVQSMFSSFSFIKIWTFFLLLLERLDYMRNIKQRNSFFVILVHFVIFVFCIETIIHTPALSMSVLLSRVSLALLRLNIPDSLCFYG